MVNVQLTTALDWCREPGEQSGRYSYRTGDVWHVVEYGPGFSNTFLVTSCDDAGLQWLLAHERKEEARAQD